MRNTLHSYITYIKGEHRQGNLMLRNEAWNNIKCNPDYNNVSHIMHHRWHDVGDREWFMCKYIELHRGCKINPKIVQIFHYYSEHRQHLFSLICNAGLNTKRIFKIFYEDEADKLRLIQNSLADINLSKSVLFYILDILDEDFPEYIAPNNFDPHDSLQFGIKDILDTLFSSFNQTLIERVFNLAPYIKSQISFEYLLKRGYHEEVFLILEIIDADYVRELEQWNYIEVAKRVNNKRRSLLLHYLIPDLSDEVLRML